MWKLDCQLLTRCLATSQCTIAKVAVHYRTLLQMNTLPILVHQESEEEGTEYFSTYAPFSDYQPFVQNLLRVADPSGSELYQKMGLGRATLKKLTIAVKEQLRM